MVTNNSTFYQIGASLSFDAPSYVERQADEEFYQNLREGKFCYVLNSRQMGKSSLRVRTMQRLEEEGTICAAIDLTGIGKYKVTLSQWYGGIAYALVESCHLEDNFEFNWQIWWQDHQKLLDPVTCLRLFIEEVLLVKVQQPIVIFVDEIDRVLSQDFSLDDFFALIRFFQNKRVDNPIFKRLTFALLGVATPGDLIIDKTQTPFNVGEGIELHGFRLNEVQSLIKGLQGKFDNPKAVMKEILYWTGGQPFLTQKLCKFMVEESEKENPRSVEKVVGSRIIKNWESQDEPEHLRTIRNRLLRDDRRAGRLLGLYQKILQHGEVKADISSEQMELRLSGLVVEQQGKSKVYNKIYESVFNQSWVNKALADLRPHAESITAWLASNYKDESRLLRGQALKDAKIWAANKNISSDDYQFLNASQDLEDREIKKALESHIFKFEYGEASSIIQLIGLCDRYPEEAENHLFNKYLQSWLAGRGRTDLANISIKIVNNYLQKKRQGLEMFVRELCKSENIEPYPKIVAHPSRIDMNEIPIGFKKEIKLQIINENRGFAWGFVELKNSLPGVSFTKTFNSNNTYFIISIDTLEVKVGKYEGSVMIHLQDIKQPCLIPITYTVIDIQINIEPKQLNFGTVTLNKHGIKSSLLLNCIPDTGRIKGTASTDLKYISFRPNFEGSSIDFQVNLDTLSLYEGIYRGLIKIKIKNKGVYEIPIQFQTAFRWENIIFSACILALLIGLVLMFFRLYVSTQVNYIEFWILSPPSNKIDINSFSNSCYFLRENKENIIKNFPFVFNQCSFSFSLGIIIIIIFNLISTANISLSNIYRNLRLQVIKLIKYRNIQDTVKNLIFYLTILLITITLVSSSFNFDITPFVLFIIKIIYDFVNSIKAFIQIIYTIILHIGSNLFIFSELSSYSFTWIGIKNISAAWAAFGMIIGVIIALVKPIIFQIQKDFKYFFIFLAMLLIILLLPFLNKYLILNLPINICNFSIFY
ncbi:AAA-like domain-containing protein [uncultured Nostoc sp.]|uniref:AAA-like domain-containing protein n=1 Tax=uncultured Nostoc sp. TaxID=340711 RepID=UPI0035CB77CB